MKKTFAISLSILIFLFSGGFTFAVSYCPMSEEWNVSLLDKNSCCCEDESECCVQTQVQLDKFNDNYVPSEVSKIPSGKILEFPAVCSVIIEKVNTSLFTQAFYSHIKAPPDKPVGLSILYRVLII